MNDEFLQATNKKHTASVEVLYNAAEVKLKLFGFCCQIKASIITERFLPLVSIRFKNLFSETKKFLSLFFPLLKFKSRNSFDIENEPVFSIITGIFYSFCQFSTHIANYTAKVLTYKCRVSTSKCIKEHFK